MAYYNLTTNEIWADSNIDGFLDDFIEIDEVIAPVIRELNVRGYRTSFCCCGHPFRMYNELLTDIAEPEKAFPYFRKMEKSGRNDLPYRVITATPANDFYIAFAAKQKSDFPIPLPFGFEWDTADTIRYTYVRSEFYAFLSERMTAVKTLHRWAKRLPQTK